MEQLLKPRRIRTAIFVDFDNMFSGLTAMDAAAAEAFATDPGRLLSWLEHGEDFDGPFRRRFLLKACYLNPDAFRKYRGFFVGAGFRVIDCPSLTQRGKSAADIHLVLDVVDAIEHNTPFDEFIVCSSDADFTPLMVRLRGHDRRTVMVAAGPAAPAYQSVCDETFTPIQMVEAFTKQEPATLIAERPDVDGVGRADLPRVEQPREGESVGTSRRLLSDEAANAASAAVREAIGEAGGALPGASAAAVARRYVPYIAQAGWGAAWVSPDSCLASCQTWCWSEQTPVAGLSILRGARQKTSWRSQDPTIFRPEYLD